LCCVLLHLAADSVRNHVSLCCVLLQPSLRTKSVRTLLKPCVPFCVPVLPPWLLL
jgi:hypothetical protein